MCKKAAGPCPELGPRTEWSKECILPPPAYLFEDVARLATATQLLLDGREQDGRALIAETRHVDASEPVNEYETPGGQGLLCVC